LKFVEAEGTARPTYLVNVRAESFEDPQPDRPSAATSAELFGLADSRQ